MHLLFINHATWNMTHTKAKYNKPQNLESVTITHFMQEMLLNSSVACFIPGTILQPQDVCKQNDSFENTTIM